MILIIESGSTKTEWVVLDGNGVRGRAYTDGINPTLQTRDAIKCMLTEKLPETILSNTYSNIYYYGAGCVSVATKAVVKEALSEFFDSDIVVDTDLVAAARGLFINNAGIACILGTGSNSCFYDGVEIVKNVRSLGYVLGDEGGGAVLGKMFLADCLKELAPIDITNSFFEEYQLSYEELIDRVYRQPFPNRFLAGFSQFLSKYIDNEYVYGLICSNFEQFLKRCIMQYDYRTYSVSFTGSIAYHYETILRDVAKQFDIRISKVLKSPIDGLIEYHKF